MSGSALLEAARAAYAALPLYRRLWGRLPERDSDIPFLGAADLSLVEGPVDLVVAGAAPVGIVPPFQRGWTTLPVTRLEAEGDWLLRQSRLIKGLSHLLAGKLPGRTVLVTDDVHGPFAADLVELLAWSRIEASLVYIGAGAGAGAEAGWAATAIRALEPDLVLFVGTPSCPTKRLPCVAVVAAGNAPAEPAAPGARLLVCDALQVVGAARVGEARIRPVEGSILLELDPATAELAVSSLDYAAAPVIRWRIGAGMAIA